MDELHSLLKRQLKRHFGTQFIIPPEWRGFIDSVNAAYHESDSDRMMLERSLEISSQELIQVNAETRSIIQLFPDAFLWLDRAGAVLSYKSSGQGSLNWLRGILTVNHIEDMQPEEVKNVLYAAINSSVSSGLVSNVQFSVNYQDQVKHFEARIIPPLSNRILLIIRDVTEQTIAEESLLESERRFHDLVDLLPVIVFEADPNGNITFINSLASRLYGQTLDEMMKSNIFDFIPEDYRERSISYLLRVMAGEDLGNLEYELLNSDGSRESYIIRVSPAKSISGEYIGLRGVLVNISERKKIEKELEESEKKYRGLVENIKLGIFRADPDGRGRFLEVNPAMQDILGYSRDELLNLDVVDIYAIPQERIEFLHQLDLNPNKVSVTTGMVKKDGSQVVVSMIVKAIKDETGRIVFTDGTIEDITERRKMEKRIVELYETEKKQRETLEEEAKARGMFIDVLAHELRTPLTPIMASVGMLNDTLKDKNNIEMKLVVNIHKSVEVLSVRLEELLEIARYARGTFKLQMETVNTAIFLREVISHFKPLIDKRGQTLTSRIAENLPVALFDQSRIEQVIVNLLSNASKFSSSDGNIIISSRLEGNEILVEVQDNGIGISPEECQRIFQPYHRVEQDRLKFPGLGLGLAVAKQIVEAHGGRIWAFSSSEKGSIFCFTLPVKSG